MNASCFLVLTLAVFGASAAPSLLNSCNSISLGSSSLATLGGANQVTLAVAPSATLAAAPTTFASIPSTFSAIPSASLSGVPVTPACGNAIQGPTSYLQTGVIEGSNAIVPSIVPPTSASKSCHCLKTLVRPQLRTEVITVPTVDRLTRIVNNPVVEVISSNAGGHNRHFEIPTCGAAAQTLSAAPVFAAPAVATSSLSAGQIFSSPAVATSSFPINQVISAPTEIVTPVIAGSIERCNNNLLF